MKGVYLFNDRFVFHDRLCVCVLFYDNGVCFMTGVCCS